MQDFQESIRKAVSHAEQQDEFANASRSTTARINIVRFYQLQKLAQKMNMTSTKCAEYILENALMMAWEAAGMNELSEEDFKIVRALVKQDRREPGPLL